jgi:curved DNA-binding protein
MEFKDYYQTLGVQPDADDKAIRQAFRELARQVHPDVNPGNKSAEARFKEINAAYEVLSDKDKRHRRDKRFV